MLVRELPVETYKKVNIFFPLNKMLGNFNILNNVLRYSIISNLIIPIYVFSTEKYKDWTKLVLAILSIVLVVTTLFYWKDWRKKKNKSLFWEWSDKLSAYTVVFLLFYFGNKETIGFTALGVLFYILGKSDSFTEADSFLNHLMMRYFLGIAVVIYVTDKPYENIFIGVLSFFTLICLYFCLRDIEGYTKRDSILF